MPASFVQRGEQGRVIFSVFFFPELGFTMNVDWYQEATLGPQSLLKTLAACQGSSNFAAQRAMLAACQEPGSYMAPWG